MKVRLINNSSHEAKRNVSNLYHIVLLFFNSSLIFHDGDCKNEYKKGFKNGVINRKKMSVTNGFLIGYLLFLKSRI